MPTNSDEAELPVMEALEGLQTVLQVFALHMQMLVLHLGLGGDIGRRVYVHSHHSLSSRQMQASFLWAR